MRNDEPLENWLYATRMFAEHAPSRRLQDENHAALNRLAQALADQPAGKMDYGKVRGALPSSWNPIPLQPADVELAQRLFLQVWERGGSGASYVMEGLLSGIAMAAQPASAPFWQQLLDLSRPRDQSATRRRTAALAALALLAITREDEAAYAALAAALTHQHEQVRAMAAFSIAQAYFEAERPPPAPVEAALTDLALHDRAFVARFQARQALLQLGLPAPLDDQDSVYFLKVQLRGNKATRTIAACADNTLADLHYAIQRAFEWDADHLYSFYMSGSRDDERYVINCPQLDDSWSFELWSMTVVDETGEESEYDLPADEGPEADDEEAGELYTTNAQLGALGLVPKHRFIYFFDYGDSHEFVVTVLGIEPRSDDGEYPRLIEARGKAPRQYHSYDDEDDEDDEG